MFLSKCVLDQTLHDPFCLFVIDTSSWMRKKESIPLFMTPRNLKSYACTSLRPIDYRCWLCCTFQILANQSILTIRHYHIWKSYGQKFCLESSHMIGIKNILGVYRKGLQYVRQLEVQVTVAVFIQGTLFFSTVDILENHMYISITMIIMVTRTCCVVQKYIHCLNTINNSKNLFLRKFVHQGRTPQT